MNALELKVPPAVVLLLTGAVMWLASIALPALAFSFPGRHVAAVALALAGGAVALLGVMTFRRARTTVNPLTPQAASSLVTTGIYRFSRNPMYLGMLLLLAGEAVFLGNGAALLLLSAFVGYMNQFQIKPEERALTGLFGSEFTAYRKKVRRWI